MYNHNSGTLETKEPNINLYTAAIVVTTTLSPANQKVTLILPEIKGHRAPKLISRWIMVPDEYWIVAQSSLK